MASSVGAGGPAVTDGAAAGAEAGAAAAAAGAAGASAIGYIGSLYFHTKHRSHHEANATTTFLDAADRR